MLLTSNFCW